jgi:hypothetical protein
MSFLRAHRLIAAFAVVAISGLAQNHTSEQSEAQITGLHHLFTPAVPLSLINAPYANDTADPTQECAPYTYGPVTANANNFPQVWVAATLLANDTAGQALWAKISPSVPDIAPKGVLNDSTSGVTYNATTDPDCCKCHSTFGPRFAAEGLDQRSQWEGLAVLVIICH